MHAQHRQRFEVFPSPPLTAGERARNRGACHLPQTSPLPPAYLWRVLMLFSWFDWEMQNGRLVGENQSWDERKHVWRWGHLSRYAHRGESTLVDQSWSTTCCPCSENNSACRHWRLAALISREATQDNKLQLILGAVERRDEDDAAWPVPLITSMNGCSSLEVLQVLPSSSLVFNLLSMGGNAFVRARSPILALSPARTWDPRPLEVRL